MHHYPPERILSPGIRHEYRLEIYRKLLTTTISDVGFEELRQSLSQPERALDINWILKEAVTRNQYSIVETLAKAGLKVADLGDVNTKTAIHALAWANPSVSATIFGMYDSDEKLVNYRDEKNGFTHFHAACFTGNLAVCQKFIDQGEYVNLRCDHRFSNYPLIMAIESKCDRTVELLLNNGANANLIDDDGSSALHHAVLSAVERSVELLLKHGANATTCDGFGCNALHFAMQAKWTQIVDVMLRSGVSPDLRDREGRTSLHRLLRRALGRGGLDGSSILQLIRLLLEHRPDLNAKDAKRNTPLFAVFDVYDFVGLDSTAEEIYEIRALQHELLEMLLKAGADASQVNDHGQTILHAIIDSCLRVPIDDACDDPSSKELHENVFTEFVVNMTELVLSHGVPIESRDCWGKTALHQAVAHMNYKVTMKLLERGARVDQLNFQRSDFEYVKETQLRYDLTLLYLDMIELLQRHGYRNNMADLEIVGYLTEPCYKIEHAQRVLHVASAKAIINYCERLIAQNCERVLRRLHSCISDYLTTMRLTMWKFLDDETETYLFAKLKQLSKKFIATEKKIDTDKFKAIKKEAELAKLNKLNYQGTTLHKVMMKSRQADVSKMLDEFNFASYISSKKFNEEFRYTADVIRGRIVAHLLKKRVHHEVQNFSSRVTTWL